MAAPRANVDRISGKGHTPIKAVKGRGRAAKVSVIEYQKVFQAPFPQKPDCILGGTNEAIARMLTPETLRMVLFREVP